VCDGTLEKANASLHAVWLRRRGRMILFPLTKNTIRSKLRRPTPERTLQTAQRLAAGGNRQSCKKPPDSSRATVCAGPLLFGLHKSSTLSDTSHRCRPGFPRLRVRRVSASNLFIDVFAPTFRVGSNVDCYADSPANGYAGPTESCCGFGVITATETHSPAAAGSFPVPGPVRGISTFCCSTLLPSTGAESAMEFGLRARKHAKVKQR
jgi:hypothetical protein